MTGHSTGGGRAPGEGGLGRGRHEHCSARSRLWTAVFLLRLHVGKGEGPLWGPIYKALTPFMGLHPHDLITSKGPTSSHHPVGGLGFHT